MRKKKERFIKRFAKIFGLSFGGLVVVLGLVLCGYWIFGAFNPPNIPLTGIVVNTTDVANNAFYADNNLIINGNSTFKINPEPLDGTEKELFLHVDSGSDVISVPETAKIGEDIAITVALDNNENIIGGEATIKISTSTLWTTYLKVFVDVPVESITLSNNAPSTIYPGNTFNVYVSEFLPINSQNPSTSTPKICDNKVVTFYSTNANVATVDESTGVVSVISSGAFKIGARVFKTYYDELNQPNEADYEFPEDYLTAISTMTVSAETATLTSNDIAVDNIAVTSNVQNINLLQTTNKTITDLAITLNKPAGSLFTEQQLNYKKYDIEIIGGKLNFQTGVVTIDTNFVNVKKTINTQNVNNTIFKITSNSYVSNSSNPCLIVAFHNSIYDEEGALVTTLQTGKLIKTIPLNIVKTDVTSLSIQGNDPENASSADIVLELGMSNYNLNEKFVLLPATSTYKTVKFFAKPQTTGQEIISVDLNNMIKINNVMHYLISYNDNEQTFEGIIKALKVGNVQIYAVVVKTDIQGNPLQVNTEGTHFEYALEYYSAISNVSVVEKINSITPILKDENNIKIEKTGDVYILAKDQIISLDLYANIVGAIAPDAIAHNANQIITDAFKYGLLTFTSSNSSYLSVNSQIKEGRLNVELTAEAKVTQVALKCFYRELGSEDSKLMFEITMQIFANTISQLNLSANQLTDITINASINENSNSVVWDNFTTALAILPTTANVGNVTIDYRCTTANAIDIENDTASTEILEITYNAEDDPVFTFHKAGVVYVYATLINSEFERVNSNLIKITVKTPIISITNVNNIQGQDLLPLNFETLPGTFEILRNIVVTVTDTSGVSSISQNGSILQLALTQNDNNRATLGMGAGNEFKVYLGQVAQNRTIKIKLFSELDTIGQVLTLTVKPDVKGLVAYPAGKGFEEVYSGNIVDLLADTSIETLNGFVPRIQLTNLDGTKNLITETKQLVDLTEVYVYDIDFSFSTNKAFRLVMGEAETLVIKFGTVSVDTSLTISVKIDLTTDDASAITAEIYSVDYIVLIKPRVKIEYNFGNDKFTHNGVDYLNIFSGSTTDLLSKLSLTQISTISKSGQDIRGINYTGDVLSSSNMIDYVGTKLFSIISTNLGGVQQNGSAVVINENAIEKKILLSSAGILSSIGSSFISSEFMFVAEINCGGVIKQINIKYVPLNISLVSSVLGAISVLPNQVINVIDEYVVAIANSNYQNFSYATLKSKLTLSLVTTGLTDITVENNQLAIGDNPTIGQFIVKASYGTNEINIIFEIK